MTFAPACTVGNGIYTRTCDGICTCKLPLRNLIVGYLLYVASGMGITYSFHRQAQLPSRLEPNDLHPCVTSKLRGHGAAMEDGSERRLRL